ncbi:DUF6279 family lipoprotein [Aquincola sp. MAHUQ-54]|uniref:DUF6279 family lipoprotein n=1 Tax=Aquincola agrisoli TaxID=3119538 RepID=A0AAW9Q602_9BURK
MQLAYNQAPQWVAWRLGGYVDLDDDQGPRAREAIDAWFRWHRSTQLPDYAAQLARLQSQVMAPTTPAAVCQWETELLQRADAALAQVVAPAAAIAVTLTPVQWQQIERRYEKSNEDWRKDFLQPDLRVRREAHLERNLERLERLYGRLDAAQQARVAAALAASPFDPQAWQQERLARQQDTLQTLRSLAPEGRAVPAATAQAAVRGLLDRWVRSPRPAYAAYQRKLNDHNCHWIAELHNSTTPAQRQHARERLRGWEADALALSRRP